MHVKIGEDNLNRSLIALDYITQKKYQRKVELVMSFNWQDQSGFLADFTPCFVGTEDPQLFTRLQFQRGSQ